MISHHVNIKLSEDVNPYSVVCVGDLFNDLSKEWDAYSRQRSQDATSPKSLWEELADLGEEFIEFLEKVGA